MRRKLEPQRRSPADGTFDFDFGAVALDHAVHHRETEPGSTLAFGGIERLQAATAGIFIHADAGIAHLDRKPSRRLRCPGCSRVRNVNVPPFGIASTALKIKLVNASRISCSAPMMSGRWLGQSGGRSTIEPRCCGRSLQRGRVNSIDLERRD